MVCDFWGVSNWLMGKEGRCRWDRKLSLGRGWVGGTIRDMDLRVRSTSVNLLVRSGGGEGSLSGTSVVEKEGTLGWGSGMEGVDVLVVVERVVSSSAWGDDLLLPTAELEDTVVGLRGLESLWVWR